MLKLPENEFKKLVELVEHLRGEEGCPWDREQTIESLKDDVLSESDELRDAIDNNDHENMREEIGDLIWGLVLMSKVAEEDGLFGLDDVIKEVNEKIVRRHPHVFGDVSADTVEDATKAFNDAKMMEKSNKKSK